MVFIHGLGMSHRVWTVPEEERVFFGNAPLTVLVRPTPPERRTRTFVVGSTKESLRSPFHLLQEEGFTVLAYSQARPAAKAEVLVEELKEIIKSHEHLCQNGVIFVAHSRGGLILRAYLQKYPPSFPVLKFFSLGCPHKGSNLAKLPVRLHTLVGPLEPLLKDTEAKRTFRSVISKLIMFLSSEALKELLPGSEFIASLEEELLKAIPTYCIAGTEPRLIVLYRWNKNCLKYSEMVMIPNVLTERFKGLWPDEMLPGKGDGLVAKEKAIVNSARASYVYQCNHAEIIYDPEVHRDLLKVLREEI